jgi:hypothetical protein
MVCNISAEAKYIYLMASDPSDGTKYIYLTVSDPSEGAKYIYLTVSDPSDGTKFIYLIVSAPSGRVKKIVLACSAFFHRSLICRSKFPCSFRQTWRLVSNSFNYLALSDDNTANLQHYFEKRNITGRFFCGEP